jgi:hypothetical protein
LLQLVKEYNIKTDKIFIQLDYIYNMENEFSNVFYPTNYLLLENATTKKYFEPLQSRQVSLLPFIGIVISNRF